MIRMVSVVYSAITILERISMKKHTLWAIVLTGLFTGQAALANHHESGAEGGHKADMHGGGVPHMFGKFDKNNDGRISRDEVRDGADKMFTEIDTNKDGFVSKDEMRAHHASMMREPWKAADTDGDGALSRAEVEAGKMMMMARDFDKLDKNKDGKLTPDEIKAGMQARMPRKSQTD